MVPSITKLALDLNSRVKVSQNSILALLLNGTNAGNPIGFPISSYGFATVEDYFDGTLRQWLFRNSSLSGSYPFPICQTIPISNIPHPLIDGDTI